LESTGAANTSTHLHTTSKAAQYISEKYIADENISTEWWLVKAGGEPGDVP
jgi:hypothetical protein